MQKTATGKQYTKYKLLTHTHTPHTNARCRGLLTLISATLARTPSSVSPTVSLSQGDDQQRKQECLSREEREQSLFQSAFPPSRPPPPSNEPSIFSCCTAGSSISALALASCSLQRRRSCYSVCVCVCTLRMHQCENEKGLGDESHSQSSSSKAYLLSSLLLLSPSLPPTIRLLLLSSCISCSLLSISITGHCSMLHFYQDKSIQYMYSRLVWAHSKIQLAELCFQQYIFFLSKSKHQHNK